ncbi:MAG: tetratricopeptide repeat protein [Pseudomonadota bacterium]
MTTLQGLSGFVRRARNGVFAPLALILLVAACDSVEERVEKHYERGQELIAQNAPKKAMLEFRNALKLNDEHVPSHFAVARLHEDAGRLNEAFKRYLTVTQLDPAHVEAHLKTTRFYISANEMARAREEVDAALALAPELAEVHALDAAVALKEANPDAARAALDRALQIDPQNIDVALVEVSYFNDIGDPSRALDRADEALDLAPENLALHVIKLQLLERLDNQPALGAQLRQMAEVFPDELRFRESLARWAIRTGDLDLAEAELFKLSEAQPGVRRAVYDLVRFLRIHKGDEAARAALAAKVETAEEPFNLQLMLAQFDVETGDPERAIADLRELIETAGENANMARVVLARLLLSTGDRDGSDALVTTVLNQDATNVDALVLRLARLIEDNEIDQAIQTVRLGLEEEPDDVRLLLMAGRAQELAGNLDLANDRLASAVRSDGYQPETVERYVQFLLRSVRFTAAETVLAEAIRRHPSEARLVDFLGFTRLRLQNWLGAEEAARALEGLNPDRARQLRAAILIGQERFDEGASLLRDGLPEEGRSRALSIAALIQAYVRDGKIDEAIVFLEDLLEENPQNLQALGMRGNFHLAAGELEEAEVKFRQILAIDPDNGGAHSALSRLFLVRGDDAAAENLLLEGLELSPDNLILLARLAQYREVQGRFDEAIDVYDRLYDRVPDSLLVANNLASLLSDHRADQPEQVERAYTIASRLRPSDLPQYRDTYGWTRYLKGEYKIALERIGPVVEALPNNPWVHYHLGMVYVALERPGDARPHLDQALGLAGEAPFPPRDVIQKTLNDMVGQ